MRVNKQGGHLSHYLINFKKNIMKLGASSISLSVKDLAVSKLFYEKLGFKVLVGEMKLIITS